MSAAAELRPGLPGRLGAFDVLRGVGILGVLFLHFSLYNYAGVLDLDMSDPPVVIKVIGFALMWASLFAVISGAVLVWSVDGRLAGGSGGAAARSVLRRKLAGGGLVLAAAYLYFLVLGPGIFDFTAKTVDRSLLVGLAVEGRALPPSPQRWLYVDSLVMIGLNLLILAGPVTALLRRGRPDRLFGTTVVLALAFLGLGLVRIPLYAVYEDLARQGSPLVFPFNFLVNKNNPLLPFLGFGCLGAAIGCALRLRAAWPRRLMAVLGAGLLVGGAVSYVLLPDTMLKRSIDETWFCIMLIQAGFLTLVVLAGGTLGLRAWRRRGGRAGNPTGNLVREFGRVSLSVFLAEPVMSALGGQLLGALAPGWNASIAGTLAVGLGYLAFWVGLLLLWRRAGYRFGLEWFFARVLDGPSRGDGAGFARRWPVQGD
jgi:peptidoglycan/LPS O-acetylase OafA/YrhL